MALGGEKIYPLTGKGLVSIDWKATKKVTKGDLVRVNDVMAFALHDAKKNETVSMCIRCDLVEFPRPADEDGDNHNNTIPAGQRVWAERNSKGKKEIRGDVSGFNDNKLPTSREWCGIVHEDAVGDATRIKLVFASYI